MTSLASAVKNKWDLMEFEQVADGMKRKMIYGKDIMVSQLVFEDGFVVPQHSHHNEQVTQVVAGRMRFWLGENKEEVLELGPGEILVIPSNLPHEALMIGEVHEIDIFSPPRQDWIDKSDDYLRK